MIARWLVGLAWLGDDEIFIQLTHIGYLDEEDCLAQDGLQAVERIIRRQAGSPLSLLGLYVVVVLFDRTQIARIGQSVRRSWLLRLIGGEASSHAGRKSLGLRVLGSRLERFVQTPVRRTVLKGHKRKISQLYHHLDQNGGGGGKKME